MKKEILKKAMIGCMDFISNEIMSMILSIDSVNESIEEIRNLTKGMSTLEILSNIDIISKISANQSKVKRNEQEQEISQKLMDSQIKLTIMVENENIPTLREMSVLTADLFIALGEYEKYFKNNKDVKMPSKELYKVMLSLVNTRIIAQCN